MPTSNDLKASDEHGRNKFMFMYQSIVISYSIANDTYAGLQLGHNWRHIDQYSRYLEIVAVIGIIAFVIWILYNIRKK